MYGQLREDRLSGRSTTMSKDDEDGKVCGCFGVSEEITGSVMRVSLQEQ